MLSIEQITARYREAKKMRMAIEPELRQAFYYVMPEEFKINGFKTDNSYFSLYDTTATAATKKKVGEIVSNLFPAYHPFVSFHRQKWGNGAHNKTLEEGEDKFHEAIRNSNFYPELQLALTDAMISNGNLIIQRGTPQDPLQFRHVPLWQVYHHETQGCELTCSFVKNSLTKEEVLRMFGKWGELKLGDLFDEESDHNNPNELQRVDIIECYYRNDDDTTDYIVFAPRSQDTAHAPTSAQVILQVEAMKDLAFIAFRYGRIGGCVMGRGNVLMALPDIRMVNLVQQLHIKNKQRALGGILAFDHTLINPKNIVTNTGNFKTLNVPNNVRLPSFVENRVPFEEGLYILEDMREKIKRLIFGEDLPNVQSGVRSATEYQLRARQHYDSYLPDTDNLRRELFNPLVIKSLKILQSEALADSNYFLSSEGMFSEDGAHRQFDYEAENGLVQEARRVKGESQANAIATLLQLFPNHALAVLKSDEAMKILAKNLGLDEKLFRTPEEIEALSQQADQALIASQQQGNVQQANIAPNNLGGI